MLLSIRRYKNHKEVVPKSMLIKWDVPKGLVHRFRDCFFVLFLLCRNVYFLLLSIIVEKEEREQECGSEEYKAE